MIGFTDLGPSPHQTVRQLERWSEAHRDDVSPNQAWFDAR